MTMLLTILSCILLFVGAKLILDLFYDKNKHYNNIKENPAERKNLWKNLTIGSTMILSGIVVACISLSFVMDSIYQV